MKAVSDKRSSIGDDDELDVDMSKPADSGCSPYKLNNKKFKNYKNVIKSHKMIIDIQFEVRIMM